MDVAADTGNREDFAGAVRMLRRQWWVVLATTLVIGAAALASALVAQPVYQSSVEVVVEPVRFGAENAFASSTLVQQELATQRRIATSQQVAEMVAEQLGGELDAQQLMGRVSAEQLEQTRVLRIVARDDDAQRAAAIAGGFGDAYLASRRQEVDSRVEEATADLQARSEQVRARIDELQAQLANATGTERAALQQERDSLLGQLGEITTQLTALQASGAVARSGGEVIREATVPSSPLAPDPVQRTALGLLVGLLLGLAIAWVRDHGPELFGSGTADGSPVA